MNIKYTLEYILYRREGSCQNLPCFPTHFLWSLTRHALCSLRPFTLWDYSWLWAQSPSHIIYLVAEIYPFWICRLLETQIPVLFSCFTGLWTSYPLDSLCADLPGLPGLDLISLSHALFLVPTIFILSNCLRMLAALGLPSCADAQA